MSCPAWCRDLPDVAIDARAGAGAGTGAGTNNKYTLPSNGKVDGTGLVLQVSGTILKKKVCSAQVAFATVRGHVAILPHAGALPCNTTITAGTAGDRDRAREDSKDSDDADTIQVVLRSAEFGSETRASAKSLRVGSTMRAHGHLYTTNTGTVSVLLSKLLQVQHPATPQRGLIVDHPRKATGATGKPAGRGADRKRAASPGSPGSQCVPRAGRPAKACKTSTPPPSAPTEPGGRDALAVPLCKHWVRSGGTCSNHTTRNTCHFRHCFASATESQQAALAAATALDKQAHHLANERHPDDPFTEAEKLSKTNRAAIFAQWLLESSLLQPSGEAAVRNGAHQGVAGARVIDVAGGKGKVSLALARQGARCTLVDPQPASAEVGAPLDAKETKGAGVVPTQHPGKCTGTSTSMGSVNHVQCLFDDSLLERWRSQLDKDSPLHECRCIVGLHPDEATETIVDVALQHNLPFAVVPCCVFPSLFPTRQVLDVAEQVCVRARVSVPFGRVCIAAVPLLRARLLASYCTMPKARGHTLSHTVSLFLFLSLSLPLALYDWGIGVRCPKTMIHYARTTKRLFHIPALCGCGGGGGQSGYACHHYACHRTIQRPLHVLLLWLLLWLCVWLCVWVVRVAVRVVSAPAGHGARETLRPVHRIPRGESPCCRPVIHT